MKYLIIFASLYVILSLTLDCINLIKDLTHVSPVRSGFAVLCCIIIDYYMITAKSSIAFVILGGIALDLSFVTFGRSVAKGSSL